MLPPEASQKALRKIFRRKSIVDIDDLFETLDTHSRMSVFRRLKDIGYMTSYTDAGRYYTLPEIPKFDPWGLWFHKCVGFSRAGTLKATVVELVQSSDAGMTPRELLNVLRLRIANTLHNTLHDLIKKRHLDRQRLEGLHLYTSAQPDRAGDQIKRRIEKVRSTSKPPEYPSTEATIAVLVQALQAGEALSHPSAVSARLVAQGMTITAKQVENIFSQYGLQAGKKTAEPPSARSRR